jgi:hypothetical protein
MKKGLTLLMAAMILSIVFSGVALATDVMIGRSLSINGTGVVNLDLEVATEQWNSGMKLDERLSTCGGGIGTEYSHLIYSSTFALDMYNVTNNATDNSTTVLEYCSDAKLSNVKRTVYTRNYILGGVMGFKNEGDNNQEITMYSEDVMMDVEIFGKNIGVITLFQKVVDVNNTHTGIVYDVSELIGGYAYNWSAYLEEANYPAAGDREWLACP